MPSAFASSPALSSLLSFLSAKHNDVINLPFFFVFLIQFFSVSAEHERRTWHKIHDVMNIDPLHSERKREKLSIHSQFAFVWSGVAVLCVGFVVALS